MKYITTIGDREYQVEVLDETHVILNGVRLQVDFVMIEDQPVCSLIVDGQSHEAYVYPVDEGLQVLLKGRMFTALVEDEREKRLRGGSGGETGAHQETVMKAPMPGLVVAVLAAEGEAVTKGQVLVILESMKMQNEIKSPRDGTVTRLKVKPGDSIELKAPMMTIV
jgi:biotin carboxyl carrier protein